MCSLLMIRTLLWSCGRGLHQLRLWAGSSQSGLNWCSYSWWWLLEAWKMKGLSPTCPSWRTNFVIALQLTLILLWGCMLKVCTHWDLSILHNNMWLEWTLEMVWVECIVHFLCLRFSFFQVVTIIHYGGLVLPS